MSHSHDMIKIECNSLIPGYCFPRYFRPTMIPPNNILPNMNPPNIGLKFFGHTYINSKIGHLSSFALLTSITKTSPRLIKLKSKAEYERQPIFNKTNRYFS